MLRICDLISHAAERRPSRYYTGREMCHPTVNAWAALLRTQFDDIAFSEATRCTVHTTVHSALLSHFVARGIRTCCVSTCRHPSCFQPERRRPSVAVPLRRRRRRRHRRPPRCRLIPAVIRKPAECEPSSEHT